MAGESLKQFWMLVNKIFSVFGSLKLLRCGIAMKCESTACTAVPHLMAIVL